MTVGNPQLPSWIEDHLSAQDILSLEALISEIEAKTEGEIVPILVRQSVLGKIPIWGRGRLGQKLLFSENYMKVSADLRAELEFYRSRVYSTHRKTGILLFMSFYEHRAVVLADKGISNKLPANTWDEVVRLLTSAVRKKQLGRGLTQAIQKCGDILIEHFPQKGTDENQLCNKLKILD